MRLCPCKSGKGYSICCQPIHNEHNKAVAPEQLMRARYSAHVLNLVDFIVDTYHPSCNAHEEHEQIAASTQLNWKKLKIISSPKPIDNIGYVEFKAFFNEDGSQHCMHERSRFVRENGLWFYIDGVFLG